MYRKELILVHKLQVVFALTVLLLLSSCGGGDAESGAAEPDPLRVGLIPNQSPESVEAQYEPFGDYLSQQLGREVELTVPTSYTAVVEAMVNDELDLAYFGGLTYVQARDRGDVTPLVTEVNPGTGDTTYRTVIIVPPDSDIEEVEDIEGRTFAFGSANSTSGSLYPAIMLQDEGIDYRTDLEEFTYTGGHDATAQAVANGGVDAGGLEDRILYDLIDKGDVEEDSVRVIEESDPIEGYPWVARGALTDDLKEQIAEAFLDLEDPTLLDLLRAESYERVEAEDYDYVEEKARELDLLTPQ
ncbi:MAG TPA: phosphate/phosphite/phosphonate ABC transporter substrate-binding protein [Rubrobacteraceae bacterium]|nr:phosphate/phosphite/phosphonate ABC transporter substrate-binding protein [Rubrobacteraceae bacterium]